MKRSLLFSLVALLLLVLAWIVAYHIIANEYILPSIGETLSRMFQIVGEKSFRIALLNTLARTTIAFVISAVFGIFFALLSYLFPWIRALLAPFVSVIRTVPTMAIILMLLLWTSPLVAPVIVAVMVLFPVYYAAVLASLDEVNTEFATLAKCFKVSLFRQIFQMYLPLSAPAVLAQTGSVFSMGLKITVSAEVLSLTYKSLGGMMQEAKMYAEMSQLFALTLFTVLLGFLLEGLCLLLAKSLTRKKNEV